MKPVSRSDLVGAGDVRGLGTEALVYEGLEVRVDPAHPVGLRLHIWRQTVPDAFIREKLDCAL
jgi:hypothetical protein